MILGIDLVFDYDGLNKCIGKCTKGWRYKELYLVPMKTNGGKCTRGKAL